MKRILLVDEQAHVLRVIKLSLDRNGFEVDTALGGDVALKMLREQPYDAVIIDNDMPLMSGQQFCEAVHRDLHDTTPLIFIVSDKDSLADQSWIEENARIECVEKPMSLRWLVARLNEYFGHYGETATG